MLTFKIDDRYDLVVDNLSVVMTRDIDACTDVCKNYASTLTGEMIHYLHKGIPFFESPFGSVNEIRLKQAIRDRLLEIPEVLGVPVLDVVIDNKEGVVKYTATIETIYGSTSLTTGFRADGTKL